jgi:hypothetical protein
MHDADIYNSSSIGTPPIQLARDYYPFAHDDGGRLAPMAVEFILVDRFTIVLVVVRRFPSLGAVDSRSLWCESFIRMKEFVRRLEHVPLHRFLGDVRCEFMRRLSTVRHDTLGSYLLDAVRGGGATDVACLPARWVFTFLPFFFPSVLLDSIASFEKKML